jgi:hypothetical protein
MMKAYIVTASDSFQPKGLCKSLREFIFKTQIIWNGYSAYCEPLRLFTASIGMATFLFLTKIS